MLFFMDIWWILFGMPLVAMLVGWLVLRIRSRFETNHLRAVAAIQMATSPVALANGALLYVY